MNHACLVSVDLLMSFFGGLSGNFPLAVEPSVSIGVPPDIVFPFSFLEHTNSEYIVYLHVIP